MAQATEGDSTVTWPAATDLADAVREVKAAEKAYLDAEALVNVTERAANKAAVELTQARRRLRDLRAHLTREREL